MIRPYQFLHAVERSSEAGNGADSTEVPPSLSVGVSSCHSRDGAPHPTARRFDVFPDMTPPRPQDVATVEEQEAWFAAHSDEHTVHRCVLGPMHDGNCRCHCQKWFEFGSPTWRR